MPADIEIPISSASPSPYSEPPESGGVDSPVPSDNASEYSPPPQPYIDAPAPEKEAEQLNISPDYSPSPAPYFTQYPSPPPYVEVEAPEVYEAYTPTLAPAPEPSSVFGSEPLSDTDPGSPDSEMAPDPTVLPSNYRAEDDSIDFDDEYYSSEQSKNRVTMVGFVLGAVCVVGLAGILFNKKKNNKSNAEYDYELAKREDL
ncbi:vegetative cell wall protein gp1-like [Argentina anserina]|uniref:vegetative cell wall protein gp1-like n=1 Tax=Argentina anserina TaxID=57926 RepID=UPI0021767B60|nr:vegetative cell wall protein gp1-like [Potentilla anserina]